ncbi:MAG: ribosome maturation factor RimM [Sphingobium sp.]
MPDLPVPPPSGENRQSGSADDRPVVLAAIIGAHGVTGDVRLKLFGEGAEALRAYKSFDAGGRVLTLKSVRPGPNGAVARFAELTDRTHAEALRGTQLTVPRSALPPLEEGEYYHVDLIGLPCVADTGEALGGVVAVENFGAGDILEIERPAVEGQKPRRFMVPIHAATVEADRAIIDAAFVE